VEQDSKDGENLRLTDSHFDEALRELLFGGGDLTRNLLGFVREGKDAIVSMASA
jgi:hypothetical protein